MNEIENKTTKELIELFKETEKIIISIDLAEVRGWIMDELNKRHPKESYEWIDSDLDIETAFAGVIQ